MSLGYTTVRGRNRRTKRFALRLFLVVSLSTHCLCATHAAGSKGLPAPLRLTSGWELQDAGLVLKTGEALSRTDYQPAGWHRATVPGTVLTSLVNDGVYPEPLYGENNRTNTIPDSLCRADYWYRTTFTPPPS